MQNDDKKTRFAKIGSIEHSNNDIQHDDFTDLLMEDLRQRTKETARKPLFKLRR